MLCTGPAPATVSDPGVTARSPAASAARESGSPYQRTLRALTGHSPGNIDDDRYFEAWVNQTVSVLRQYTNRKNR